MTLISMPEARRIAACRINELEQEVGFKLELLEQSTVQVERGWVFFYNSADFIHTGNTSDALAGNGPLFVSHDGKLTEIPSSMSWQKALSEMEKD